MCEGARDLSPGDIKLHNDRCVCHGERSYRVHDVLHVEFTEHEVVSKIDWRHRLQFPTRPSTFNPFA
ncbi:MAG: hypothetical protein KIS74_02960 [Burkholderiales bacterium]|nr:hypothetical protein [Burkholderiales bacterium]